MFKTNRIRLKLHKKQFTKIGQWLRIMYESVEKEGQQKDNGKKQSSRKTLLSQAYCIHNSKTIVFTVCCGSLLQKHSSKTIDPKTWRMQLQTGVVTNWFLIRFWPVKVKNSTAMMDDTSAHPWVNLNGSHLVTFVCYVRLMTIIHVYMLCTLSVYCGMIK